MPLPKEFTPEMRKLLSRANSPLADGVYKFSAQQAGKTFSYKVPLKPQIKNDGVQVGAVEAWRLWRTDGYRLFSLSMREKMWLPMEPMTGNPDKIKEGVYAFKDPLRAQHEFYQTIQTRNVFINNMKDGWLMNNGLVLGQVKLWGNIIEHEHGYRAENARVMSLIEASGKISLNLLNALYIRHQLPIYEIGKAPVVGVYEHTESPNQYHRIGIASGSLINRYALEAHRFAVVEQEPLSAVVSASTARSLARASMSKGIPPTLNAIVHYFRVEKITRDPPPLPLSPPREYCRWEAAIILAKNQGPENIPGYLPMPEPEPTESAS